MDWLTQFLETGLRLKLDLQAGVYEIGWFWILYFGIQAYPTARSLVLFLFGS